MLFFNNISVRKIILVFIFFSFSFIFITEELLSSKVRNLVSVKFDCSHFSIINYCDEFYDRGEISDSVNKINNNMKNYIDKNKKYNFRSRNYDVANSVVYDANLLEREWKVLNRDLFINENIIKDNSLSNLDRVTDYYPSIYKRDSSNIKVLAVSDSYVAGTGLYNFDYTWAGTLEHKLLDSGYNVEVDRFARNGANFPDFLEMLSSKNIELIDPDVIVISVYKNDLLLPINKSDSMYIKCIKNGYGNGHVELFSKSKFPFIYSYLLSRKCDLNKLKAKYGDLVGETNYAVLEDAPFAEYYKNSMKKILDNANGRPVVIQPLFLDQKDKDYEYIKDYLGYFKSIGFILPEFDSIEVFKYSEKFRNKLFALPPVDLHYSRFFNLYLSDLSFESITKILKELGFNKNSIDFENSPSVLRVRPNKLLIDSDNYIEYNRLLEDKFNEKDNNKFIKRYGALDIPNNDEVLCTSINRPSVRVYLNYFKHKNDNLAFNLITAESEIAVIGIYFSENGEELYTEVNIIKPGERAEFTADEKIVGLILGSPISGCDNAEVWSMPSFLGKIIYN
jgi:hypothetical protein